MKIETFFRCLLGRPGVVGFPLVRTCFKNQGFREFHLPFVLQIVEKEGEFYIFPEVLAGL